MVTPKYLNLFTFLRLVPRLSLMFAFVPLRLLTITSVFPVLIFSPLLSIPICQPSHLPCISSSVSVTTARSSANSSSRGNPRLNSSLMTSSTTINRNGLSPDPWCRPTLMGNSSVQPCVVLTTVDAPWYVASTSLTSFSGTPLLRRHRYTRSLGTLSYAFSKYTKVKNKSLCTSRCFSCSCCVLNTASVVAFPGLNPNCMLLTVISFLSLRFTIFSNIFIPCSNNLMPLKFPYSSGSPFCLYLAQSHFSTTLVASVPLPKLSSVFHASCPLHSPLGV